MAYLELILFIAAIVGLIYWAQRARLKPAQVEVLRAVATAEGLALEQGTGTASVRGQRGAFEVRVHAIMDGWAVTVQGEFDAEAAHARLPDAQVGADRLQIVVPLAIDPIRAAIAEGLSAVAQGA